jgi:hypothetical protein
VTTPVDCQNCGAALAGRYCSACGQKADVRIVSLGQLLAEAIADLYNFDSRMWRSLGMLVLKPGRLTRLYLGGKRARYTPPFRMYVVTSLTFFLVFALVRALTPPDEDASPGVDAALQTPPTLPPESLADGAAGEAGLASAAEQEVRFGITIDDDDLECTFDPEGVDPAVRERLQAACERVEEAGAASFTREFADNFPITMLVFIPLVAGIMKLLYLFAGRKYVEHLVFCLHVHTFFFVVALLSALLAGLVTLAPALETPALIVGGGAWLYFVVYLYLAMREVYAQSHGRTAVKYAVLGGSYFFAALLTLLGAVAFTAVTI